MTVVFMQYFSFSQTSNVKIIDLSVIPQLIEPIPTDGSETLKIEFKIKNVQDAAKVYILFGTTEEGAEVLQVEATFIESDGIFSIDNNGDIHEVKGYAAEVFVPLTPDQSSNYQHITIYVEDTDGNFTEKLKLAK